MILRVKEYLIGQLNFIMDTSNPQDQKELQDVGQSVYNILNELNVVYDEKAPLTLIFSSEFYYQCSTSKNENKACLFTTVRKDFLYRRVKDFYNKNRKEFSNRNLIDLKKSLNNAFIYKISWDGEHYYNYTPSDLMLVSHKMLTNEYAMKFLNKEKNFK